MSAIPIVTLQRGRKDKFGTFGTLTFKEKVLCVTLEEPWKDNEKKISCIPAGTYPCVPHTGARFKNVWEVRNVPGRTAILIHAGNTLEDTEGCILVGTMTLARGVGQSQRALSELRGLLPLYFNLEVKD